MIEDFAPGSK